MRSAKRKNVLGIISILVIIVGIGISFWYKDCYILKHIGMLVALAGVVSLIAFWQDAPRAE